MESILKNVYINKIQIPKFHGHVRLELRGCRETEIVENDNHMTDALNQIMATGMWRNASEVWSDLCPTYEKAFGSILLTDKSLPDDALMVPGGTEVTACAAYNVANNDDALTQGSYNSKESVMDWSSKKMTYVYDWTTNQGNGTIAAAALSHVRTGYCGYGDAGIPASGNKQEDIRLSNGTRSVYIERNANKQVCLVTDLYKFAIEQTSDNSIIVTRYSNDKFMLNPLSMSLYSDSLQEKTMTCEKFTLPASAKIYIGRSCTDGEKIYFFESDTLYKDREGTCTIVNTSDMTIDTFSLKNNTGYTIYVSYGFTCYKGYMYMITEGNKLLEINMKNTADIKMYSLPIEVRLNGICTDSGKIFLNSYYNKMLIYDTITKSIKPSKLGINGNSDAININQVLNELKIGNNFMNEYALCLYLATISNLDKPVQKTADKTMKVTYTIQQE